MQPERRVLPVGKLTVRGGRFAFEAAPAEFTAQRGELLALGLAYDYVEASRMKEGLRLCLVVQADGQEEQARAIYIGDMPGVTDTERGHIPVPLPAAAGPLKGTFRIEASYTKEPWPQGKAEPAEALDFHRSGRFAVRVA